MQVDLAFQILLKIPLSRLAREGKAPMRGVVIMVRSDRERVEHFTASHSDFPYRYSYFLVKVDGLEEADVQGGFENPLLMVLSELFPSLPTFCRLVISSRTEVDTPHIVHCLRNKFLPMEVS